MKYRYRLVILFNSGNLWEVGCPTKELARTFARLLVGASPNDVEIMSIVNEKTDRLIVLDPKKFMN